MSDIKEPPVSAYVRVFFDRYDQSSTAAEVAAIFTSFKDQIAPPLYNEIVDGIEAGLAEEIGAVPANVKAYLKMALGIIEEAKQSNSAQAVFAVQALKNNNALVPMCEAFNQVARIQGDKSGPATKIFAEEAAKMSDAEYGDTIEQIKLILRVSDRISGAPASPASGINPFRGPSV